MARNFKVLLTSKMLRWAKQDREINTNDDDGFIGSTRSSFSPSITVFRFIVISILR